MKKTALLFLLHLAGFMFLYGQHTTTVNDKQQKPLGFLIDQYSQARGKRDTVLLKAILVADKETWKIRAIRNMLPSPNN